MAGNVEYPYQLHGKVSIQPLRGANSTDTFEVKNQAGTVIHRVDTSNSRIYTPSLSATVGKVGTLSATGDIAIVRSTGQNFRIQQFKASSSGDTAKVIGGFALGAKKIYHVEARAVARVSAGTSAHLGAAYTSVGAFRRSAAGKNCTKLSATAFTNLVSMESLAAFDFAMSAKGASCVFIGTGDANANALWYVTALICEVSE